ncbi:MAG: hypothetical protein JOZ69_24495 [Myxococcales bacterium]|nr:hypothetical protein [Myxococcales bacterium]
MALWTQLALAGPARLANAHAEHAALQALKKAVGDYLAMSYAAGAARLRKAFHGCAPNRCTAATRAALLRDIGTM